MESKSFAEHRGHREGSSIDQTPFSQLPAALTFLCRGVPLGAAKQPGAERVRGARKRVHAQSEVASLLQNLRRIFRTSNSTEELQTEWFCSSSSCSVGLTEEKLW